MRQLKSKLLNKELRQTISSLAGHRWLNLFNIIYKPLNHNLKIIYNL